MFGRGHRSGRAGLWLCGVLVSAAALLLTGCDGFFVKSSSNGSSSTGNYAYVFNAGSTNISGYQISTAGALTAVTNSPYTVSYTPTGLAVSRANAYLYVSTSAGIYGYTIGSGGVLTTLSSGALLASTASNALETSPDGKWLLSLDAVTSGATSGTVSVYAINSDGTLSLNQTLIYAGLGGTAVPTQIKITPNGQFVYAAMGTGGTLVMTFNTSSGALASQNPLSPIASTSDYGLDIDANSAYLYLVRSGTTPGLSVFAINSSTGAISQVGSTYSTGSQPHGVALGNGGTYVYVANYGSSTISGYTVGSSGVLTANATSPYSSGAGVISLAQDSTGSWLLAAAYSGLPDVTLYGYDSTSAGRIYTVATTSAGTYPSLIVTTH